LCYNGIGIEFLNTGSIAASSQIEAPIINEGSPAQLPGRHCAGQPAVSKSRFPACSSSIGDDGHVPTHKAEIAPARFPSWLCPEPATNQTEMQDKPGYQTAPLEETTGRIAP